MKSYDDPDAPTGAAIVYAIFAFGLAAIVIGCICTINGYRAEKKLAAITALDTSYSRSFPCQASYYSTEHGRRTASGAVFDSLAMTCAVAHALNIPFGTRLWVIEQISGNGVEVVVNDAVPDSIVRAHPQRWIDLSAGAFAKIADKKRGVISVEVSEVAK